MFALHFFYLTHSLIPYPQPPLLSTRYSRPGGNKGGGGGKVADMNNVREGKERDSKVSR